MRDYGKMFLGLILTGIVLIVVGLFLARAQQSRTGHAGELRPIVSDANSIRHYKS